MWSIGYDFVHDFTGLPLGTRIKQIDLDGVSEGVEYVVVGQKGRPGVDERVTVATHVLSLLMADALTLTQGAPVQVGQAYELGGTHYIVTMIGETRPIDAQWVYLTSIIELDYQQARWVVVKD